MLMVVNSMALLGYPVQLLYFTLLCTSTGWMQEQYGMHHQTDLWPSPFLLKPSLTSTT
jgi:hypothetical protein